MTLSDFLAFDLDKTLIKALFEQDIIRPTSIQQETISSILEGKDVLGTAPTGTGKTLAFLIPTLQYLLDFPRKKPGPPRVLIMAPTRELALQIADQARLLARYNGLKVATITGGVAYLNHADIFSKSQDIVVATPGRLLQYIGEENFDCRAIEILILDEADRMLDMGFTQDIEQIATETRWRKQTLLFSATLDNPVVDAFAARLLTQPIRISADPSRRERKKIVQFYYHADNRPHKDALLCALLSQTEVNKSIIFVRTKERVHELAQTLREHGIKNSYLEGDMAQTQRNNAILYFEQDKTQILIATDVAARGLDIANVSHVFNYDLPRHADVYLHRIGRTARAGQKGTAIALVEAHDYTALNRIMRYLDEPIKRRVIDTLKPKTTQPTQKNKKKSKKPLGGTTKNQPKKKPKIRDAIRKNKGKRRQATPSAK